MDSLMMTILGVLGGVLLQKSNSPFASPGLREVRIPLGQPSNQSSILESSSGGSCGAGI